MAVAANVAPTILKAVDQEVARSVTATVFGESTAQEASNA